MLCPGHLTCFTLVLAEFHVSQSKLLKNQANSILELLVVTFFFFNKEIEDKGKDARTLKRNTMDQSCLEISGTMHSLFSLLNIYCIAAWAVWVLC